MLAQVLCLMLAAANPGDPSDPSQGYDVLLEDAVRARAEGRLEESLQLLRRANALQPSPGLRNNIARVLEELGRWREAVAEYRSVAADPTADAQLRDLDDQRIAELSPKLLYAWIYFDLSPESVRVLLDGRPVPSTGRDQSAPAGTRTIEAKLEGEVVLETIDAPIGQRTTVKRDLGLRDPKEARIAVDRVRGAADAVVIDRYRLRSTIDELHTIRVRPGSHTIGLELRGVTTASAAIQLRPGETYDASILLSAAPPAEVSGARVWPYFAGGGGVAAAVVGGVLLAVAESSRGELRAEIEKAEQGDGIIYDLTRERAEEIESGARVKSNVGLVLVGAGVAAIGGAIAGWAFE